MKTSIVIATLNSASTIRETLDSLIPYFNGGFIEDILVIDGHSRDGTIEIVNSYPVKVIVTESKGYSAAREIGWRNAQGDLIIFLDSDAYLASGFFPQVYQFFDDDKVGLVGCFAKAVITNIITKTTSQEWDFFTHLADTQPSFLMRIYCWLQGAKPNITPGGPCHIVRRICLEETGGFPEYAHAEDIALADRIHSLGWKTLWWVQPPVFHHPRSTVKALLHQSDRNGNLYAVWQFGVKHHSKVRLLVDIYHLISLLSRLGSPFVGIILAINFRNPMHIFTFTISRYAWLHGYFKTYFTFR